MADATNLPPCVATAPPRIWLQVNPEDDADLDLPFPHGEEVTWCSTEVGGAEVEYTRTDLVPRLDRATLDDLLDRLEGTESAHDLRVMLDGALRAHVELARQRDNLREKLLAAERYVAILRSDLADATRDLAARQQLDAEAAPANREESEPAG